MGSLRDPVADLSMCDVNAVSEMRPFHLNPPRSDVLLVAISRMRPMRTGESSIAVLMARTKKPCFDTLGQTANVPGFTHSFFS